MSGWTGKRVNNSRLTHWLILALLIVEPLHPVNTATLFVIRSGCLFRSSFTDSAYFLRIILVPHGAEGTLDLSICKYYKDCVSSIKIDIDSEVFAFLQGDATRPGNLPLKSQSYDDFF